MVSFKLDITFSSPPLGTLTDQLDDTVCYSILVQTIQILCQNKRFNLIEHLSYAVYQAIMVLLKASSQKLATLKVTVHKIAPPVPGVHGGVIFTYAGEFT